MTSKRASATYRTVLVASRLELARLWRAAIVVAERRNAPGRSKRTTGLQLMQRRVARVSDKKPKPCLKIPGAR